MLDAVLEPLRATAITVAGAPTSWAEVVGFVTGAFCVWLVARNNIWNWPVGILNNLAFLVLFATAGIYADAGLQIVYLGLAAYGWWAWLRGGERPSGERRGTLPISTTSVNQWQLLLVAGLVLTGVQTSVLIVFTDSTVPLPDAITTALSLLATWGQARRKVESWYLWIAADLIYVPLYGYKGLWLTAVLYLGFLALCVFGLREWRRLLHAANAPAPSTASA